MVVNLPNQEKQHCPVDHRHREIKDQQIVVSRQRQLEAIFGIGRRIYLTGQERRERFPDHAHERNIVIYDQYSFEGAVAHEWTLAPKRTAFQVFPMQILLELTEALRERLGIIQDEESRRDPAHHIERLRKISEKIELLEHQLPPTIDPQLRHFLQRRSYNKALELLTT